MALRGIGLTDATIAEIDSQLPDWVDVDEAGVLLQLYGLTRDQLISRLGGSP